MENFDLYQDIAKRTNGDIYVGVVGPVRCGKSTFIREFMKTLVLPNITDKNAKERTIDELPQSADGKTIMTTQPNFVPAKPQKVVVNGNVELNVKMIDCVGYLVDGAIGHEEGEKPRLVKTPWSDTEIPFEEAAELGTKKVIEEHSCIAIAMTTDGTISEIPRANYVASEERIVRELKENNKPFVMVLNSSDPNGEKTKKLASSLEKKYSAPVVAIDVAKLSESDIENIFDNMLKEFPIKSLQVNLPDWMSALPFDDERISKVIGEIVNFGEDLNKIGQVSGSAICFESSEDFEPINVSKIKLGEGVVVFDVIPKPELFYKVLSSQCGQEIKNDYHLVSYIKDLSYAKKEYDKLKIALNDVGEKGYGIVCPNFEDMTLEEPEIVKQGSRFGVKLRATAPSLHIMKVDIETEVNPLVGTEEQSAEMVKYLMNEFDENPSSLWQTNIFGKSLNTLVKEGIDGKIASMPLEAERKMRKTLGRIVNEGKGGIICILL